ncbi:leucine-rich repeat domain-containing protein, partial [Streptomyces sp. NPDC003483]
MTDEAEPRLNLNCWDETSDPAPEPRGRRQRTCSCFSQSRPHPRARVGFHVERQDTSAPGWRHLLELVDEAVADGREEFLPLTELSPEERRQIITLPPSIAQLTA